MSAEDFTSSVSEVVVHIPAAAEAATPSGRARGGWRVLPLIVANEVLEKVASVGLLPVCIEYLMKEYGAGKKLTNNFVLLSGAAATLSPIFGAWASTTYGRFMVIAVGSLVSLGGMVILWLTAMVDALRPPHVCTLPGHSCPPEEKVWRLMVLASAFAVMAVGAGGIRPCSPVFGADQINDERNPNNRRTIEGYYGLYYSSVGVSVMISISTLSRLRNRKHLGWSELFSIPALLMLLSIACFLAGSSLYVKVPPATTASARKNSLRRVLGAAWRRRRLPLPPMTSTDDGTAATARWYHPVGSTFVSPTHRLRFLNRACMVVEGEESGRSCTVRQVEELKALLAVVPIWSTGIIIALANNPGAFPNFQAQSMDLHFIRGFTLTPPDYILFNVGTITLWAILHARVLVPFLARLTSNRLRNGIPPRVRMAMGLAVSGLANLVAGLVEHRRRRMVPKMSGNWLIPQYFLMGLAEGLYMLGVLDFFNSRLPTRMRSLGNALLTLGQCFGMLASALLIARVGKYTSWIKENLNAGRYDYYYWLVAGLSAVNLCYFGVCSWVYGKGGHPTMSWDDDDQDAVAVVGPDDEWDLPNPEGSTDEDEDEEWDLPNPEGSTEDEEVDDHGGGVQAT